MTMTPIRKTGVMTEENGGKKAKKENRTLAARIVPSLAQMRRTRNLKHKLLSFERDVLLGRVKMKSKRNMMTKQSKRRKMRKKQHAKKK